MKHLVTFVLLVGTISGSYAQSQQYTVIHVMGEIYNPAIERNLQRGDKLSGDVELSFKTTDAKAAVLSNTQGRYVIQAKKEKKNQAGNDDLTYVLKAVLIPARGQLSTRGGEEDATLFIDEMKYRRTAWIADSLVYHVSSGAYPMDDTHYFHVQYRCGHKKLDKKLEYKGDRLIFYKPAFYQEGGKPIDPATCSDYTLYYYNGEKNKSEKVTAIRINVVPQEEVQAILDAMPPALPDIERKAMAADFVNTLYGYFEPETIGW